MTEEAVRTERMLLYLIMWNNSYRLNTEPDDETHVLKTQTSDDINQEIWVIVRQLLPISMIFF